MWRNDQNKFVIVCHNLVENRNTKSISNCTLSMLTYILAYLKKIPDYIRDEIDALLIRFNKENNQEMKDDNSWDDNIWEISGKNSEKMKKFIDLNLFHSQKILCAINLDTSVLLVKELLTHSNFALYNRQYMMWYYGDLTIYGENRINNLLPGEDFVYKGIDYFNCFYTLYYKIYAYFECTYSYPLLEFDLFTILDLACSRQLYKHGISVNKFFYTDDVKEKEIYTRINDVLKKYICNYESRCASYKRDKNEIGVDELNISNLIISSKKPLEEMAKCLIEKNIEPAERYVYYFFKLAKKLFPES